MASIEGKRGMPNPRPPFPAVKGLFGKPTNINNVETLANIAVIMTKGGDWFASVGTEKSKGTKVFALAGKISYSGLVEIPMGTPLREIIEDIGGGIPNKRKFKAAQTGGPSGGCIPAAHFDVPMDYENLTQLGAIMGSGGLIVTDEHTCMVDMAKFFLTFTQKESCGKCVPCRLGTKKMLEILTDVTNGKATLEDLDQLVELAEDVKSSSLCGLGQTAPNPALSTVRYPQVRGKRAELQKMRSLLHRMPHKSHNVEEKRSRQDRPGQMHRMPLMLPGLPVSLHRLVSARKGPFSI
jgi:NADH:ubiquinone oxidoreductase subunit F (NADH-binding)